MTIGVGKGSSPPSVGTVVDGASGARPSLSFGLSVKPLQGKEPDHGAALSSCSELGWVGDGSFQVLAVCSEALQPPPPPSCAVCIQALGSLPTGEL